MSKKAKVKKKAPVLVASEIVLKDKKGNVRMCLEASDARDNTRITIFGKNSESLCLTIDGDSTSMIGLLHRDGRIMAGITVSPTNSPSLILSRDDGSPVSITHRDLPKNGKA